MNNAYRSMMEQQNISAQARRVFYEKLQNTKPVKKSNARWKTVAAAAYICLLVTTTVFAVDSIFGLGIMEWVDRPVFSGNPGIGYDIYYEKLYPRPITDFSQEVQRMDSGKAVQYASWEDAEEALGIDLITNEILSDRATYPVRSYQLEESKSYRGGRAHCYVNYICPDGQFSRASVRAAYGRDGMSITVAAMVIAEYPAVEPEELEHLDFVGVTYQKTDVEEFIEEQYTAASGLQATILTIEKTGGRAADYEANFAANGIAYRITVRGYENHPEAKAKALLIEILESFVF